MLVAYIASMASVKYYIDEVWAGMGMSSDDALLDRRQIMEWMRSSRATLIRNIQTNDKKDIDDALYQVMPCVKMELVDRSLSECCESDYQVGCQILRSEFPLPRLLFTKGQYGETNSIIVNCPDVMVPQIIYGTRNTALYGGNGRYNKKALYTFVEANKFGKPYLYCVNKYKELALGGRLFYIKLLAEDPMELANYVDCNGTCLFNEESEYPISGWMWELIRLEIIKKISIMYGKATDKSNNSTDDQVVPASGLPQGSR